MYVSKKRRVCYNYTINLYVYFIHGREKDMRKFHWKKLCASTLACIMLVTGIPASAFAQTPEVDTISAETTATEVTSTETASTETTATEVTSAETVSTEEVSAEEISMEDIYESNLPVVYINTENGVKIESKEVYVNATMKIQGNDTYADEAVLYDGEIEIRGRGNSTWEMDKKPYKIKLDKKSNLFGMGKNKHWVLLANYSDPSLMRNTLAYNLSGAMGMPQMETVWVDVVLNGEYVGNYQFCEQIKIDKNNRVSIFDWESFAEDAAEVIATAEEFSEDDAGDLEDYMKEEDMSWITGGEVVFKNTTYKISDYSEIEVPSITGGYLMELDEYYDEVSKFTTNSGQPVMFKNPEFVSTNQDMMNYIQTYIQSFEDAVQSADYTANYEGNTTHYSDFFDFDALVDYWLINEIFFNEEINKKSTYMYKDIEGLVYMGPIWDMDYSSGGEGDTWRTNEWATIVYNTNAQANMWYKDLIKDPYFILKAQERYWEIRDTHVQDMVDSIDTSYALLKDSADANAECWYGKRNFDYEVDGLKDWFYAHLEWLDAQMASENSILSSLGYESANVTLSVTDSTGKKLRRDTISTQIAADALANIGESIILNVSSENYAKENADVFVNGKKISSVQMGSNLTITAEQLTAENGEKNIIEVKLIGDYKPTQDCITVIETDTSLLPPEEEIPDPEYDGRDYPTNAMTAIADSEYTGTGNEGPAGYVLDGNEKTHWHTNWDTTEATNVEKRWIGVELAETIMVDGIRCLPRQDGENGVVTSYEIQYRVTADEEWKTVATGNWDTYDTGWKLVSFQPVEAKYIRIVGVHTYADKEMDAHMSMAELRVQRAGVNDDGTDDDDEKLTYPTEDNKIPVVYINTENGVKITSKEDYVNATMKIQGNDTYSDSSILYDGEIEIRGRGNSTWGMPKKPYKIKLDKKSDLFGMGKNKHWVLLANYSDPSLMRNTLAYNLSGAMEMPQMETVWVDVVLNGEYVGNYQFCEQVKIDKNNRVSIFDWESFAEDAAEVIATAEDFSDDDAGDLEDYMKEEDMSWITGGEVVFKDTTYKISDYPEIEVPSITGGYLMELDEYYDEVSKFTTNSGQPIMFKNPEFVGTNQDMMNYVQTYIQSFENAVQSSDYTAEYEGTTTHYSQLFDFDALVDYWLINEIFFNEEFNKKSTYMYKDIEGPVYMGPMWDMDYSSGGMGNTGHTDQWATTFFNLNAQANMWYKDLIKDPYFILKAQERYWEIRDTSVQDMVNSIDSSYTLLKDSADANADIWYDTHNFESEVNELKGWFNTHLTWLDSQMASEDSLLSSLGYETKDLTLSANDIAGNALPKDTVSEKIAADALINSGESIILTVSSNTIATGKTEVFVNSKKIGSVQIGSNVTITGEQLTAEPGEKNIIEVKLFDNNKTVQNCITVLEKETSPLPPEEPGDEEDPVLPEFRVEIEEGLVYNAKAQKPEVKVYDGAKLLTANKDYKILYKNNKNAGLVTGEEFDPSLPYVEIQGKGNYHGVVKLNFEIKKASISDNDGKEAEGVKLSYSDQLVTNTKKAVNPFKSIRYGKTLKKGTDFEVTLTPINALQNGETLTETPDGKIPAGATGTFELKIKGIGNYEGEIVKTVTVADKTVLLKNARITLNTKYKSMDFQAFHELYEANGNKMPEDVCEVIIGGTTLAKDNYTVQCENIDRVGTATLIVEGKGTYQGSKSITFKLTGKKFSNATLQIEEPAQKDYTGEKITQDNLQVSYVGSDNSLTPLTLNEDYIITYKNNLKKGKATMYITAKAEAGYQGTVKKTFTIKPEAMEDVQWDSSMNEITVEYEKAGVKPKDRIILTNKSGQPLVYGKDYTVSYEKNKEVGTALMKVKGKGNYTGSIEVPFTVIKASFNSDKITITVKELAYNKNKADSYLYKPGIVIKDGNKKLKYKQDYEFEYVDNTQIAYKNWLNDVKSPVEGNVTSYEGVPRVIIKGLGNYETTEEGTVLELPIYETKFSKKNLHVVISDSGYTGNQSTPEVAVYYTSDNKASKAKNITSEEELIRMGFVKLDESEYSTTFGTNIFAGKNKGTVKVSGKSPKYGGSVTFKFHINSKEIKR